MSALAERAFALRRTAAIAGAGPGTFLLNILLCAAGLAIPLFIAALLYAATPWSQRITAGPEISVFVALGTARSELEALRGKLAAVEGVTDVRLIPRDQALAELSRRAGLASPADTRANPLPDVLVARFGMTTQPGVVERAAAAVKGWAGVDAVQSDIEWHRRLAAIGRALVAVLAAVGAMTLVLILLVLVTAAQSQVRLRQEETDLLQLVGARPSFINRPYAYASALTLGLGAMLSLALSITAVRLIEPRVTALAAVYGQTLDWPRLTLGFAAAFVVAAALVGWTAGWIGAVSATQRSDSM
jgi:cell division transport system permease protein